MAAVLQSYVGRHDDFVKVARVTVHLEWGQRQLPLTANQYHTPTGSLTCFWWRHASQKRITYITDVHPAQMWWRQTSRNALTVRQMLMSTRRRTWKSPCWGGGFRVGQTASNVIGVVSTEIRIYPRWTVPIATDLLQKLWLLFAIYAS